jgi:NADH dehydrogenase FAD-containing subunit
MTGWLICEAHPAVRSCTQPNGTNAFSNQYFGIFPGTMKGARIIQQASTAVQRFTKPKVLIVGSGWAGFRMATDLDKKKFNVELVSPRNHFLFTPLLPSTAVGTLEFRAIQEPVRTIPNIAYYQASVEKVDINANKISCIDAFCTAHHFDLQYDALVLAAGCETATFGVQGVLDNDRVFFLKQLKDARSIRNRLIDCFERASSPACTPEEIKRLLTFVVVGGGPTSVEFASELYDFLVLDVSRWYPDLHQHAKICLVEASGHILGTFNSQLVKYVEKLFAKRQIHLMTSTTVSKVDGSEVIFTNGESLSFGLMVWSTGIKQLQLVQDLDAGVAKFPNGRLKVDDFLRVQATGVAPGTTTAGAAAEAGSSIPSLSPLPHSRVFAMGDCAGNAEKPLPALAQVASQQGKYLAAMMNKHGLEGVWNSPVVSHKDSHKGRSKDSKEIFKYQHMGSMASVGEWKGVYDSTNVKMAENVVAPVTGFVAFALWRSAYWTKQVSITNKILILMYWFKSFMFGRDISRF